MNELDQQITQMRQKIEDLKKDFKSDSEEILKSDRLHIGDEMWAVASHFKNDRKTLESQLDKLKKTKEDQVITDRGLTLMGNYGGKRKSKKQKNTRKHKKRKSKKIRKSRNGRFPHKRRRKSIKRR